MAALLMLFGMLAHAQSPPPLSTPNLGIYTSGEVHAVVRLPDGSVVVGGNFTSVHDPITQLTFDRNRLAKFSASGALDLAWNPSANASVHALAIDPSGAVYAAGNFTSIGGQTRNRIAKLSGSGTGAVDPSWNPSANDRVFALAIDPSGALYAGGLFTAIGGQTRSHLAKLSGSGTGAADPIWNPSADNSVAALAIDPSGALYAGGNFTALGGQTRIYIAKLSGSGTGAADPSWNPSADNTVLALAVDPSGALYAGGVFTYIGGQTRNRIAKLSGSGAGVADPTWNPSADSSVSALAVDPSGALYVGGGFTAIGGQTRNYIAKLSGSGTGAADPSWNPSPGAPVHALALDVSGGLYAGGRFSEINAQLALGYAHLSASGILLISPYVQARGFVWSIAVASDGSSYVGGEFARVDNSERRNVFKLSANRVLDSAWNPSASGSVFALAIDPSGALYAGGLFTAIGGQTRNRIAKLSGSGTGSADPSWNPSANNEIRVLAIDTSGALYAGGSFTSIGGQARNYIAKLPGTGTGAADPSWNPSANGTVLALAVDPSGALYAGGFFTAIGGQTRNRIAKLSGSGTGAADPSWNPSANSGVYELALDPSGALYAGGSFTSIGGQARNYIAKLPGTGTGAADPSWNPSANSSVYALAIDLSGALYAGGYFTAIGGQARSRIAKLSGSGMGAADPSSSWNPAANNEVYALAIVPSGVLYAGGSFGVIGGTERASLAALPLTADPVFRDGFEGL